MPRTFECVKALIASAEKEAQLWYHPPKGADRNIQKAQSEYPKELPPIALRLIRVELASGEIEVLATSLLDQQSYPMALRSRSTEGRKLSKSLEKRTKATGGA